MIRIRSKSDRAIISSTRPVTARSLIEKSESSLGKKGAPNSLYLECFKSRIRPISTKNYEPFESRSLPIRIWLRYRQCMLSVERRQWHFTPKTIVRKYDERFTDS